MESENIWAILPRLIAELIFKIRNNANDANDMQVYGLCCSGYVLWTCNGIGNRGDKSGKEFSGAEWC